MTNDILEQLAEDYFRHLGYFTQHNVKYKPNKLGPAYAVHSDVDLVGVHPKKKGVERVVVVSCKSWHGGLHLARHLKDIKNNNKKIKKTFREIALPIWSKALKQKIKTLTGQNRFVFFIVSVSYAPKQKGIWENYSKFIHNLSGCPIRLLDMKTIVQEVSRTASNITPAHSELARLLQMIYHSRGKITYGK